VSSGEAPACFIHAREIERLKVIRTTRSSYVLVISLFSYLFTSSMSISVYLCLSILSFLNLSLPLSLCISLSHSLSLFSLYAYLFHSPSLTNADRTPCLCLPILLTSPYLIQSHHPSVWAVDGSGRSLHKLVRTLTGHAHRINSLALNCDYVLRTGAFQIGEGSNYVLRFPSYTLPHLITPHLSTPSHTPPYHTTPHRTGIAIAGGGTGSQAAAEGALDGDSSIIQDKALQRYQAVVGSEGER
jgi:hypothetical protein